jgi:hypothetical protein
MRTKIIASAAAFFIGGAGVLTLAVPASAATAPGTPVTVEVTGGALTISAPTGSVDLGSVVVYTAPQATVTGTATVTPTTESSLYPGGRVQDATDVDGNNTATWDPTIAVTIPADALAGTYSTSFTHSVS